MAKAGAFRPLPELCASWEAAVEVASAAALETAFWMEVTAAPISEVIEATSADLLEAQLESSPGTPVTTSARTETIGGVFVPWATEVPETTGETEVPGEVLATEF